jgi:hypothetical protein
MSGQRQSKISARGRPQRPKPAKVAAYGCTPVIDLPGGWKRYVHINGGVYYHNAEHRIVTDCDVSNEVYREGVMEDWEEVMEDFEERGMMQYASRDAEVVMRYGGSEDGSEDGPELWEVAIVSHSEMREMRRSLVGRGMLHARHLGCS